MFFQVYKFFHNDEAYKKKFYINVSFNLILSTKLTTLVYIILCQNSFML